MIRQLFFTVLLLSQCFIGRVTADEIVGVPNRIPGAVMEFDFLRSDCLKGRFLSSNSSSSSGQQVDEIIRQGSSASCLSYNGLSAGLSDTLSSSSAASDLPVGVSTAPLIDLLTALESSDTMTFAFWILPPPQLPTQLISSSLLSIKYDTTNSTCGFSLEIYEQASFGSRQSAAVFCNSDGSSTLVAEGVTYTTHTQQQQTLSGLEMHYLVVSFHFSEQDYQALGTVHSVLSTSSIDAEPTSDTTQMGHNIDKGSMHPSAIQARSLSAPGPHLVLLAPEVEGSSGGDTAVWGGQLLHLALYPRLLSPSEITQNFQAGLLNSLPIGWNLTVRVREDELSNISLPVMDADNQAWHINYRLNCADLAQNQSNTANMTQHHVCSKMYVRLLRLPVLGELFVTRGDGSDPLLLAENDIIEYASGGVSDTGADLTGPSSESGNDHYVLHYRPPLHQHSASSSTVLASFTLVAVDGWTGEQAPEVATVSLVVLPVNDPPVAISNSAVLHARQCVVLPVLQGADSADFFEGEGGINSTSAGSSSSHFSVAKAVVFTLPRNGTLHQVVTVTDAATSGNNSSSTITLTLESEPMPPPPPGGTELLTPFTVGYCYTGLESVVLYTLAAGEGGEGEQGGAVIGTDTFTFGVVGSLNVSSAPAVMGLQVLSQLQTLSDGGAAVAALLGNAYDYHHTMPVEATMSNLTLYGQVVSDETLTLQGGNEYAEEVLTVRIEEVPLHGSLVDLCTGEPLSRGSVLRSCCMQRVPHHPGFFHLAVGYIANHGVFTTPNVSWIGAPVFGDPVSPHDSISFSMVTISNATQQILAVSSPAERLIEDVRNRNDPSELEFTFQHEVDAARGYFEVYAWGRSEEGSSSSSSGGGGARHQRRVTAAQQMWRSSNSTALPLLRAADTRTTDNPTTSVTDSIGSYVFMDNAFKLTDWDKDTDLIRAHVISSNANGLITLNAEHLSGVDFNSHTYCASSSEWLCLGDGYNDIEMVFLGTPSNVSRVLNGLQYLSLVPHHTDWVNVTLYDGAGGDCLSAALLVHGRGAATSSYTHSSDSPDHTHHDSDYSDSGGEKCFITSVSVEIRVLGFFGFEGEDDDDGMSTGSGIKWSLWVQVGVVVVALCLLYYVCCYPIRKVVKCYRRHNNKSKKAAARNTLAEKRMAQQQREEVRWKAVQREGAGDEEEKDEDDEEILYYERGNNKDDNSNIQMTSTTKNGAPTADQHEHEHEHCGNSPADNLNTDNSCV